MQSLVRLIRLLPVTTPFNFHPIITSPLSLWHATEIHFSLSDPFNHLAPAHERLCFVSVCVSNMLYERDQLRAIIELQNV